MSRVPNPIRRSPRVYTIVLACAFALAPGAGHAPAQVQLTVTPFMTRGPADAPVTIVEFSDYQ
ncbi:MAG: hypothetical protein AAB418_05820 [candidate division NC10 bacterium]